MFSFSQGMATRYDGGLPWRRQEPRNLDDIDQLIQRMQQLRLTIGLERATYIENNTLLFADGEKFRIFHAEARQNSILFTFFSYVAGVGALNMFMPQLNASKMIAAYKPLVLLGCAGYCAVSYQIFSRIAGFTPTLWNEYNYSKMVRQLRNV